jgi:hypothetical protein
VENRSCKRGHTREKRIFKEKKTNDVTAESSFNTDTYLAAPTMTYGGNEEIVLKGPKGARKIEKSRKRRKKP